MCRVQKTCRMESAAFRASRNDPEENDSVKAYFETGPRQRWCTRWINIAYTSDTFLDRGWLEVLSIKIWWLINAGTTASSVRSQDPYPVFRIASQVPLRSGCVLKFENQGGGEIKVGAWLI